VEEENYFFRLSAYQDHLLRLIESGALRVAPQSRQNEMLAFIQGGLQDFSISRNRERAGNWGIPVPGDPSQVMYVWYDALANYVTGLGLANDAHGGSSPRVGEKCRPARGAPFFLLLPAHVREAAKTKAPFSQGISKGPEDSP
jgi:methionyl-tRNA synthetase